MSLATFPTTSGAFDRDDLAAFLAQVPAAAGYDLEEMFESTPAREHRPARTNERRRAINDSLREV